MFRLKYTALSKGIILRLKTQSVELLNVAIGTSILWLKSTTAAVIYSSETVVAIGHTSAAANTATCL